MVSVTMYFTGYQKLIDIQALNLIQGKTTKFLVYQLNQSMKCDVKWMQTYVTNKITKI